MMLGRILSNQLRNKTLRIPHIRTSIISRSILNPGKSVLLKSANIRNKSNSILRHKKPSRIKKAIKYFSILTGTSILILGGITTYLYKTDEGIRRSLYFSYKSLYPSYQYYMTTDIEKRKELHIKYSAYFLDLILELGGYYIKMAQTLCGMGVLPDEYEERFDILLDSIPQKDFNLISSIIMEELNILCLDEIFEFIDPMAIGAGSIGQVHKARLKKEYSDNNNINFNDIVIKVQYPNVESYFNMDLMTCKYLAILTGGLDNNTIDDVFDKLYESIELEFHYDVEAENMIKCEKNLSDDLKQYIKIPIVIKHLCTKNVLIMEYIAGERMSDRMSYLIELYAKSMNKTVNELKKEWKITDLSLIDTESNNNNNYNENIISFYRYGIYTKDLCLNIMKLFVNTIFGYEYFEYYWQYKMILNGAKLTRILFSAFGKAILLDGFFNSDPHSGNILLMDYNKWFPISNDIDLALIDFGNVQKLNKKQRIGIAKLLIAMAQYNTLKKGENDKEILIKIANACIQCGMESTKNDIDFLASQALMFFDMRLDKQLLDRFNIPYNILLWQQRFNQMDEWKIFPAAFFNLQRCLQLLVQSSIHAGSGTPIPSLLWKDIAKKVLDEQQL